MTITRYAMVWGGHDDCKMRQHLDGDYVLHADAQAALTAIERAAYERGAEAGWNAARTSVYGLCEDIEDRAVADLEQRQVSEYGTGYLSAEKFTAKRIRRAMGSFEARDDDNFLALLTQEGR